MNITMTDIQHELIIPEDYHGLRLDQALAKLLPDYSRARIQQWIRDQAVSVDGKLLPNKTKLHGNEQVIINATIAIETPLTAQAIALDIVYEDDDVLVVNKPPGLVVHPGAGNPDQTLVNALLHYLPQQEQLPRAGLIHRIDKDTSGLLIVAKSIAAHTHLVTALQNREIHREYAALVNGKIISGATINAPIGRHPKSRTKMAVLKHGGKASVTHYRVTERFPNHTLIRVMLETGRTHQIRVHMAHVQHPLVGDPTYAGRLQIPKQTPPDVAEKLRQFKRQALHAQRLELKHPCTEEVLDLSSKIPEDMASLLEALRQNQEKLGDATNSKS